MFYFCRSAYYKLLLFMTVYPCFMKASLSLSLPSTDMPANPSLSLPPAGSVGLTMPEPSTTMPIPASSNSIMPSAITNPSVPASTSSNSTTSSLSLMPPITPPSSTPTISVSSSSNPPSLLTATTQSSTLAPVTVTSTTTPITTSSSSLGSGITNTTIPKGMNIQEPAVNLSNTRLTQTLHELVNTQSSVLSINDQETYRLLKTGTNDQKATSLLRTNTDITLDSSGTQTVPAMKGAQQITQANKFQLPRAAHVAAKTSNLSLTHRKNKCDLLETLFNNSALEYKYKLLINQLKNCSYFIPIFTKFHILALSQIYQYLIAIYSTLTITHIDALDSYIALEQIYGLNTKTLIVQYLTDLVERQLNNVLLQLFPALSHHKQFVIQTGLTSLQGDHISRLDLLFVNMEQVVLATFGIKSITTDQWKTILNLLTDPNYASQKKNVGEQSLESVTNKLQNYVASPSKTSFVQLLTFSEKEALVNYLDILTYQFTTTQEIEDCKNIVLMLTQGSYDNFTQGQYTLLKNVVGYYCVAEPLENIIALLTSLQTKLQNDLPLSTTLSEQEFKVLQALIAFLALSFEQSSFEAAKNSLTLLEPLVEQNLAILSSNNKNLFSYYKNNSTLDKIQAQQLAQSLQQSPDLLISLNDDQQKTFSKGVAFYKTSFSNLSPAQLSLIDQLVQVVQAGGISGTELITAQQEIYNSILTFLINYKVPSTTQDELIQELTKDFGDQFKKLIVSPKKFNQLTSQNLSQLSTEQQLILYCTIQKSFDVIQTHINQHIHQIDQFSVFTLYKNLIQPILFKAITYDNYQALVALNNVCATGSLQDNATILDNLQAKEKKLIQTLCSLLVNPNKPSGKSGSLQLLFKSISSNASLNTLITTQPLSKNINIVTLADKISDQNFSLMQLTTQEANFLQEALSAYETILSKNPTPTAPPSQSPTQGLNRVNHPLSQQQDLTASTILSILHAEMRLKINQNEMVKSLSTILDFFATYTATLHINPDDSVSVITQDFSQFAAYARSIATQLTANNIQSTTPALFIYDKKTLEHLAFLPLIAKNIESTQSLFLPTQAIDMALLTNPVPSDGKPGIRNNQVIIKKNVPYTVSSLVLEDPNNPGSFFSPKFFFKDKNGTPFANQPHLVFPSSTNDQLYNTTPNSAISWLTKTTVNFLDTLQQQHQSYSVTRPLEGQEGLYMNIPFVTADQANPKGVLARLYEQKIIPQPDWLNSPEGVVAMMRACLGDFVTALELDETMFDPIINYLLRYTMVTSGFVPQDAGIPGKPRKITLEYLEKDLDVYRELSQQELFKVYVGPVRSSDTLSTQGATS